MPPSQTARSTRDTVMNEGFTGRRGEQLLGRGAAGPTSCGRLTALRRLSGSGLASPAGHPRSRLERCGYVVVGRQNGASAGTSSAVS